MKLTVGDNSIDYLKDADIPAPNMIATKIIPNSTLLRRDAQFMTPNIKHMYL